MNNIPETDASLAELIAAGPRRLAVLGSPIGHSRSPDLHRAAYRSLGLDWSYDAIDVAEGDLSDFVADLSPEWRGLSVTMPLKREALALSQERDTLAVLSGAANTLLLAEPSAAGTNAGAASERIVHGFNTDVAGLVRALAEAGMTRARHVSILGAGATAASALISVAEVGAQTVDVMVRTPAKAAALVDLGHQLGLIVTVSSLAGTGGATPGRDSDLVISTLPGGTIAGAPFAAEVRRRALLFDVAYAPWPSALGNSWTHAGGRVASGLGMLLHQALIQVRIFVTGSPLTPVPQEEAVLGAMRQTLPGQPERVKG